MYETWTWVVFRIAAALRSLSPRPASESSAGARGDRICSSLFESDSNLDVMLVIGMPAFSGGYVWSCSQPSFLDAAEVPMLWVAEKGCESP